VQTTAAIFCLGCFFGMNVTYRIGEPILVKSIRDVLVRFVPLLH